MGGGGGGDVWAEWDHEDQVHCHIHGPGGDVVARADVAPKGELHGHRAHAVHQQQRRHDLHACPPPSIITPRTSPRAYPAANTQQQRHAPADSDPGLPGP